MVLRSRLCVENPIEETADERELAVTIENALASVRSILIPVM